MKIVLDNIGRRFNREWIFRNVNYTFQSGQSYAILGPNGSGKSTLLQVIAGSLSPSEGTLAYHTPESSISVDKVFPLLSLAAPYLELVEEFTLQEHVDFHFKFKNYLPGLNRDEVIAVSGLEKSRNKPIKHFSSGMKQRTRLALAFCSDNPVILLDEPTSNLDMNGLSWYSGLVEKFSLNRLLIIGSNQEHEYTFCQSHLHIAGYKTASSQPR